MDPDVNSLARALKLSIFYITLLHIRLGDRTMSFFQFPKEMQARALKIGQFGNQKQAITFIWPHFKSCNEHHKLNVLL